MNYRLDENPVAMDLSAFPPEVREHIETQPLAGGAGWRGYYLYGIERAMVIGGKRFLGHHDGYLEGSRLLVDAQHLDGSWRRGTVKRGAKGGRRVLGSYVDPLVDTCFALLFPRRASLRRRSPLLRTLPPPSRNGG